MTAFIDLLGPAILATFILVAIHALFGLHVLKRNIVFIDLALAQMAGLGATVAFSIGYAPLSATSYAYSFGFTLCGALLLSGLRFLPKRIPHEALIGILYIIAAAATILFIEKSPQGAEHLKQLLTGNIVTLNYQDVLRLLPLYAAIGVALAIISARGSFGRTGAAGWFFDLLFYAMFGAVVTSSVSIAGVLLVFSFLIIPASMGILLADGAVRQWVVGSALGCVAGIGGLALSYLLDWSAGAAMVCAFGAILALTGLMRVGVHIYRQDAISNYGRGALIGVSALLIFSALWSALAPRADQPLLNSVEAIMPSARQLYLAEVERLTIAESAVYAERYRTEAERLNLLEQEDRTSGKLSDEKLAKITSFIKAYNEMRSGEAFVASETIARARTRNRGWLFAAQLGMGLLLLWAALHGTPFATRVKTRLSVLRRYRNASHQY